jgi:hypothetical protein
MIYWIFLRDRKGDAYRYRDSLLPGMPPQKFIEQTLAEHVDKLGFCRSCNGSICHVIEEGTGRKFCPILFHDLLSKTVGVRWRPKDIL